MGVVQIREELDQYIKQGDAKLIKMLHAIAKEYSSDKLELNEEQEKELDRRLEKYESGRMNFSSWDSVKERIRAKNAS